MDLKTELRYKGYIATPPLWKENLVSLFPQIELKTNSENIGNSQTFKNTRLGKLVEEFVFYQLQKDPSISWICHNLQIQNEKLTVGEIDALYYHNDKPVHLEMVYKFYLYDTLKSYGDPLAYWIGPNRKDNLLYKLDKLYNKQFPLLQNVLSKDSLEKYKLNFSSITQKICFKAQLFLPCRYKTIDISPLNKNCVSGYHISFKSIESLQHYQFYIPEKLDWLIIPHVNVNWMNYTLVLKILEHNIKKERSTLIWVKHTNETLYKYFITFW